MTVPKPKGGPHDRPETAPAALRAAGFKGFNCNLELVGQNRGDGANWQTTQVRQTERVSGYGGAYARHVDQRRRQAGYYGLLCVDRFGHADDAGGLVDEGGSGGTTSSAQFNAACAAGMAPFPMARIIDVSNERKPKVIAKITHEVHDPANCSKVAPDFVGLSIFTYGTHYCSVDNDQRAELVPSGTSQEARHRRLRRCGAEAVFACVGLARD